MNLNLKLKRIPTADLSEKKFARCSTDLIQSPVSPQKTVSNLVSPQPHMKMKRKSNLLFGYLYKNLMLKCTAELLQKNPKDRSKQDIKMIDKAMSNAQIFNEFSDALSEEIRLECCRVMKYRKISAGKIIIPMHNRVEDLYVLISGKVGVYTLEEVKQQNKKKTIKDELKEKLTILDANEKQNDPTFISFPNTDFITHNVSQAKYEALEDCVCAVLSHSEFDEIVINTKNKDILTEISYFSRISFFSKWKVNALKHIIQNSTSQTFKINQTVFDQESSPDNWYLIREGEFSLNRHLEIEINQKNMQNDMMIQFKCLKKFTTTQSISLLQRNEFFGIEDIIFNRMRQYSVKCMSEQGRLTVITAQEIHKLMNKSVIIQIDIQQISKEKMKFIDERIKQIEDSFFQMQIKKIENKNKNMSISSQIQTSLSTPRINLEKIQQVEDMLDMHEQFSKFHSSEKFAQSPEDIQEQIDIQNFLKLKGFHSINAHKSAQLQSQQCSSQKNGFQIKKQNDSDIKREATVLRKDLLDFYRKMIDNEYDCKKQKILNKGFKNRKVEFFNQKVLIPLQQQQKKRNEKSQKERQSGSSYQMTQSQCDSEKSPQGFQVLSKTHRSGMYSQRDYSYDQSFEKNQNESAQNSPIHKYIESTNSLDSYKVNQQQRKLKSMNQTQSIFSNTLYGKSMQNENDKLSLNGKEKIILPANVCASPKIKNIIMKTIKQRSQHYSESNDVFVNYQDKLKTLNNRLHTISGVHTLSNNANNLESFRVDSKQNQKRRIFESIKLIDGDSDHLSSNLSQNNIYSVRGEFKSARQATQNSSRSMSYSTNPQLQTTKNFKFNYPYDDRQYLSTKTLSTSSIIQGNNYFHPSLRTSHTHQPTEFSQSSFYFNKNQ